MQAGTSQLLIIDADSSFRKSLLKTIRGAGYDVVAACDEAEAIQRIEHAVFPLIVSDLWLAGRTALHLVQKVRESSCSSQIIVITPYEADEFCAELRTFAVFECLRKPVKRRVLLDVVARALASPKNSGAAEVLA